MIWIKGEPAEGVKRWCNASTQSSQWQAKAFVGRVCIGREKGERGNKK